MRLPAQPQTRPYPMDLVFTQRQIETWPIERLHPYARNAKIHGPDQVAKIDVASNFYPA